MRILPGFDGVRILAATSVIFSHSFLLAEHTEENEPLHRLTGEILGIYGVFIFFILSGFLVTDSAHRAPGIGRYALKRFRRIAPAFVACILISVLVICPLFAVNGPSQFLASVETWRHTLSVMSFLDPGLWFDSIRFFEVQNPDEQQLPSVVNGSLWTIRIEVTCYLFVGLLMVTRLSAWWMNAIAIVLSLGLLAATYVPGVAHTEYFGQLAFLAPSFAAGILVRQLSLVHIARGDIAAACCIIMSVLAVTSETWDKQAPILFPLLAAYPLLWMGQLDLSVFRWIRKTGDPSYGMYLWAWPIQAVFAGLLGSGWSGYSFTLVVLPFIVAAGYLSWYLIERPALRWKPKAAANRIPVAAALRRGRRPNG